MYCINFHADDEDLRKAFIGPMPRSWTGCMAFPLNGTPYPVTLPFDTESDLPLVQCKPCKQCYLELNPTFNSTNS